jgi:urease accessory protein
LLGRHLRARSARLARGRRGGQPHAPHQLGRDRYRLTGAHFADRVPGITGVFRCQGSFVALTRQVSAATLAAALRERVQASSDFYASASMLPRDCGAWMRVLAVDAAALREALRLAWYAARSSVFGAEPAPRRK